MSAYSIFQLGDCAMTLSLGNAFNPTDNLKIQAMKQWIEANTFQGLLDIVTAYSSLTIVYDLYSVRTAGNIQNGAEFVKSHLQSAFENSEKADATERNLKMIPVCYEAPFNLDSEFICSQKNISIEKLNALHCAKTYQVYMIGFLPGFPYMGEVDQLIASPRKDKPRTRIEAGSVGIAGIQTGVYPIDSPGGWQIIGKTPVVLFDEEKEIPAFLEAGDTVKFYQISKLAFEAYKTENQ